jgi:hypothetical protein
LLSSYREGGRCGSCCNFFVKRTSNLFFFQIIKNIFILKFCYDSILSSQ